MYGAGRFPEDSTIDLERRLQKSVQFYWVLTRWMELKITGHSVAEILEKSGYSRIAVYGYAELGRLLCQELLERWLRYHMFWIKDYPNGEGRPLCICSLPETSRG